MLIDCGLDASILNTSEVAATYSTSRALLSHVLATVEPVHLVQCSLSTWCSGTCPPGIQWSLSTWYNGTCPPGTMELVHLIGTQGNQCVSQQYMSRKLTDSSILPPATKSFGRCTGVKYMSNLPRLQVNLRHMCMYRCLFLKSFLICNSTDQTSGFFCSQTGNIQCEA